MTPIEHGTTTRFLGRALVLGLVVFGAVRLAIAGSGVSGGSARSSVTVSGTLTGVPGAPMATFHFRHGATEVCSPPPSVTISNLDPVTHSFSVEVPVDNCPALFDGSDVSVTIDVNGVTGVVSAQAINPVPYAHYASHVGTPDCPVGYERDPSERTLLLCRRMLSATEADEVVRVGSGAAAFWIDRFEATVCPSQDGPCSAALNTGTETDLTTRGLPRSGDWRGVTPPMFARSVAYSSPPTRWVTWFQAQELCRASGKRLPTGEEWLTAARGASETGCQTSASGPRNTADGATCLSEWGVRDMVGNVSEWTTDWYAGTVGVPQVIPVGDGGVMVPPSTHDTCSSAPGAECSAWPDRVAYGDDITKNVSGGVHSLFGGPRTAALPASAQRGGAFSSGAGAGRYFLALIDAPSHWRPDVGFRCVIPR